MAADRRGRRPEWNDYKKLQNAIDEYFEICEKKSEENGRPVFPDLAGMCVFLKIDDEKQIEAMCAEGAPDADEFRRIFNMAYLRRKSWCVRNMVADNKMANGCMNALKQEENGGYSDRKMDSGEKTLRVKIDQIAGGMNAMK